MIVRAYLSAWVLFTFATTTLFLTGNFTMLAAVVLGFFAFGLIFMGMIGVLPFVVTHPAPKKAAKPARTVKPVAKETPAKAFGVLKSA